MKTMEGILYNNVLICSISAWFIAQVLKIIITRVQTKKFDFSKMVASGGMPSSHSAIVMSLSTAIGLTEGFDTIAYAMSLVFALVVMYDASGVRRAAGKQAKVLNKIVKHFENKDWHIEGELKELIGHTPVEVLAGAALGILVAMLFFL